MKIYNEAFDEHYIYEELDNGLKVYIFHRPSFQTTSCAFGTPYGALSIYQKVNGKKLNFNPGIAHFLEHKLFESDQGDILNIFTSFGASANAFTSYHETVYHFQMAGDKIEEPLNLLLDFVQDLKITKESVEKEKDIINQEIKMYQQMPDVRLLNTCFEKMYHHYPLRYDVGGNEESVYAITKEELEECYRYNYHPSNMILVITSYLDPFKLLKIVKDNQAKKTFEKIELPTYGGEKEPLEVVSKETVIKMDVTKKKHIYGIKIKPDYKDIKDLILQEWCMRILLEAHFSQLNPDYQKWLDEGIINDYFGYEVDYDFLASYILFYYEQDEKDAKDLRALVLEELQKPRLQEETITQLKRRYLGIAYALFNDLDSFNTSFIRDRLNGFDIFEYIDLIQTIDLKMVLEVYEKTSFENYNFVSLVPNTKENDKNE